MKVASDLKTGACVLNWNSGAALVKCLRSLEESRLTTPIDIVVVDNASTDDSLIRAQREFPHIEIIRNIRNPGFAAGHNLGAEHLVRRGCRFIAFVNPDVNVDPHTLSRLTEALATDESAGLAGGAPSGQSDEPQVAARTRPTVLEKLVMYGPLHRIPVLGSRCRKHVLFAGGEPHRQVYAVCGACMMFRAEAFREIGGFDDGTFLYEEEMISAERLRAKSWDTILVSQATYTHAIGGSTDQIPYRRRLYFIASEQYLVRKYYRWNLVVCNLLRLYRYVEWLGYAVYRSVIASPRLQESRQSSELKVSRYS